MKFAAKLHEKLPKNTLVVYMRILGGKEKVFSYMAHVIYARWMRVGLFFWQFFWLIGIESFLDRAHLAKCAQVYSIMIGVCVYTHIHIYIHTHTMNDVNYFVKVFFGWKLQLSSWYLPVVVTVGWGISIIAWKTSVVVWRT